MATPKLVAEAERLGILPKTEYRRQDYFFQREQSRHLRSCDWEDRPTVSEPWWLICLSGCGYILFCIAVFMVLHVLEKLG